MSKINIGKYEQQATHCAEAGREEETIYERDRESDARAHLPGHIGILLPLARL